MAGTLTGGGLRRRPNSARPAVAWGQGAAKSPPAAADSFRERKAEWWPRTGAVDIYAIRPMDTHMGEEEFMKKTYEAPSLVRRGDFRTETGLLEFKGNDRLILSKN
ncbi:keywimysin-related RiPP [Streptomyces sp. NPDC020799]|uniref:keywimysin-related RiPP n=1 Tax=Streptomyces sp. NPDC020799 TaxID=3365091 RepID=UPI00378FA22C